MMEIAEMLRSAQEQARQARAQVAERLKAEPALAGAYGELLVQMRDLCVFDPRKGEPSPKAFARAAREAAYGARRALAILGGGDGVARGVIQHMGLLELQEEDRFWAALACAQEDPEGTLASLAEARLEGPRVLAVALTALEKGPVLDFAEYKTIETLYTGVDPGGARSAFEIQRRYEQARAHRVQHARRHLFALVPEALKVQPSLRFAVLSASLGRDPFGTLDHFRENGVADPFAGLSTDQRLDLLDQVAALGLGLASTHLDLFAIPGEAPWIKRLQGVFRKDMTAGSTILGVYAMEGMHHYPFGLDRIEPALPRRITNADALAHLRRGEPEGVEPREFSTIEVGEAADRLQQLEVQRFLGVLKSDIAYYWEASVQERKLDILFADPELKIRDILFLLGQALFEPEESFETIFRLVQRNHPLRASNIPHILVLANRYYYLDVLGLNPGLLFTRSAHASGGAWTPIEEAGAFGVRTLLHVGTAIHLQVGDELFRAAPVAWRILLGQYDGKVDAVIQDLTFLLDGFDSLLAIMGSMRPDLRGWVGPLVDALAEDAADLPPTDASGPPKGVLRLTTRATLDRCRERLNQFCLMALWRCAEAAQVSPINVLQNLRLPRTKTDKLRALLEQGRQEPRKQRNRDLRLRVRR